MTRDRLFKQIAENSTSFMKEQTLRVSGSLPPYNKDFQTMENTEPKYEYHLFTWGGFYSEQYFKIHQKPQGDFWFDTAEARQQFIDELKAIEEKLNARHLAMTLSEGYCCRTNTVLHRVIEWEGKRYYSKRDMGINYPISAAIYHLKWKWTCGFNDYPLGEDFDYVQNQPKVIQEWITGAEQDIS